MDEFYVTLPSNSSMKYYPDNTLCTFTTILPHVIELQGNWEVGLVEIQYPYNWYNIPTDIDARTFNLSVQTENGWVEHSFHIPPGYYPDLLTLVRAMMKHGNHGLKIPGFKFQLHYLNMRKTFGLVHKSGNCRLTVPSALHHLLGIDRSTLDDDHSISSRAAKMEPLDALFVYCDVMEPRVVGDSLVPLLRIVPVQGEHGRQITQIYQHVHYFKVQKKKFQTIEINIRDHTGKKVSFEDGTLNVTLHFRQHKRLSTL
jgi:hypothetical protein